MCEALGLFENIFKDVDRAGMLTTSAKITLGLIFKRYKGRGFGHERLWFFCASGKGHSRTYSVNETEPLA